MEKKVNEFKENRWFIFYVSLLLSIMSLLIWFLDEGVSVIKEEFYCDTGYHLNWFMFMVFVFVFSYTIITTIRLIRAAYLYIEYIIFRANNLE